ncbi:hypothetical protein Clacol_000270 [Clathrus columnatus]|uniref:Uncharacterized protein n=1 Tax=Clathrus columnatus TaxID=1419009 RepID=A0AAV5A0H4_9AGAM|nr:hypothetical protein Clacol_000270 [Clathrus columnatus]
MNRLFDRSSTSRSSPSPSGSDAFPNNKLVKQSLNKSPRPSITSDSHGLGSGRTTPSRMSRTLALASTTNLTSSISTNYSDSNEQHIYYRAHSYSQPPTRREMYWASRAIHSETLLAATARHQQEIKELMRSRADELKREHDNRKAKLEWLSSRRSINFILPNHFTIPILSPFTSVVESESSIFNTRFITLALILAGIVTYGLLRHRINLSHRVKQ